MLFFIYIEEEREYIIYKSYSQNLLRKDSIHQRHEGLKLLSFEGMLELKHQGAEENKRIPTTETLSQRIKILKTTMFLVLSSQRVL